MASKRVLVLGAGLCPPPLIRYLHESGYQVLLASRTLSSAENLIKGLPNASAIQLNIESDEGKQMLDNLAPKFDAIVSMLPYVFHPIAAAVALKYKKHFFTTSYVSDAMKQFHQPAVDANLVFINECGVDPGTDHMSAMRVIDKIHEQGGEIVSFTSYCGGLPAPNSNDNPFGYKLSWAPRGVLLASRNDAHFLKDGKQVFIPGRLLFENYHVEEIPGVGVFEAYPNRDSTKYINIYGIHHTQTMIRGTYRYPGWCPTVKKLADLGYLDVGEINLSGKSFAELTASNLNDGISGIVNLKERVGKFLGIESGHTIIDNIQWLGLFDDKPVPSGINTCLDVVCHQAKQKWVYKDGEQDMLVMKHEFIADYADRKEWISSTMVDFGIPHGYTSMSRTVSLPIAIAIHLVLSGKFTDPGIHIPIIPKLYNPILDELQSLNIKFVEKVEKTVNK